MAMRATQHNSRANTKGRVHGTRHNDRNFDTSKADNIDGDRSQGNIYLNYYNDKNMTFEQVELKFYEEHFGDLLAKTNANYIKNRHPERCKTMEEWKKNKRYCPEETTMQIGDINNHVFRSDLIKCFNEYSKRLNKWSNEHENPFTTLDIALHVDEAVPHIQSRRVWTYETANGLRIGQEKALAAAGVELPDPGKPEGRHNNRKMTFDAMCREMWLDVIQEHGIEVEREALPDGKRTLDKEDYIREKYQKIIDETEILQQQVEELKEQVNTRQNDLYISKRLSNVESRKRIFKPDEVIIKAEDLNALEKLAKETLPGIREQAYDLIDVNREQQQRISDLQMQERFTKAELEKERRLRIRLQEQERRSLEADRMLEYYQNNMHMDLFNDDGTPKSLLQVAVESIAYITTGEMILTERQKEQLKTAEEYYTRLEAEKLLRKHDKIRSR